MRSKMREAALLRGSMRTLKLPGVLRVRLSRYEVVVREVHARVPEFDDLSEDLRGCLHLYSYELAPAQRRHRVDADLEVAPGKGPPAVTAT